jgi:hypothetical protein
VRRTFGAVLVVAGMAIGFMAARMVPEPVVSAQTGWQYKSWTFQEGEDGAVGTWLGQAMSVQLSSNGIDVAWHSHVVGCKQ